MTDAPGAPSTLSPDDATRLVEFARACKAAARAVTLYPAAHPAIAATLGRIVQVTSPAALPSSITINVQPDRLLMDGRVPARPDPSIAELATLLHEHLVGELTIHPGGDAEAWRSFLMLLARPVDVVRADGGIAQVWTMMAGRHVELREIDYRRVLAEREDGLAASWERVVANCLEGHTLEIDEEASRLLRELAGDPEQLGKMLQDVEQRSGEGGALAARTAALVRMLRGILDAVGRAQPDRIESTLKTLATAVGHLSADSLLALLTPSSQAGEDAPRLVGAIVGRMPDSAIAGFVARDVIAQGTATDRLAQAFQSLVPDGAQQERLLSIVRDDVSKSPLGRAPEFEGVWNQVTEKLLASYTDKPFVSEEYGRELSGARSRAIDVERVSDDPPERMAAWLGTVSISALRGLDLDLLLDLLRIEQDASRWRDLMGPVVSEIEDLALVGDFDAMHQLIAVVVAEAAGDGASGRKSSAARAVDALVTGPMMRHILSHLATVDDAQFARLKDACVAIGEPFVQPLAEALSTEDVARARDRLTAILIAFGATGRRTVERLKGSQNAAVRRTAIYLLREFGGSEALPDLAELLDDSEPPVQREAVRAILNIGTDRAYRVLEEALKSGSNQSRESIMQAIAGVRDERATPLFTYILSHVDHRGPLRTIYQRAIEGLGALRDPVAVPPLKDALYRGEWWAPWRTAALRGAAAAALARIGTPDAVEILQIAATTGPRGVRAAAGPHVRGSAGAARSLMR